MIHVIILTKQRAYGILEVPENGQLLIKEDHLLCGITQNGVRMIPYGDILTPWEIFIWDNTLSLEMLPNQAFSHSGRVLDFLNIELLQVQATLNPSQSGSVNDFIAPTYTNLGHPVKYNFMVKGLDFANFGEVEAKLKVELCNGIYNDGNGYQHLSLIGDQKNWGSTGSNVDFRNSGLTDIYDLGYGVTNLYSNTFDGTVMKRISMNWLTVVGNYQFRACGKEIIYFSMTSPNLAFFGSNAYGNGVLAIGGAPLFAVGCEMHLNKRLQTALDGISEEGDLTQLQQAGGNPNIIWHD